MSRASLFFATYFAGLSIYFWVRLLTLSDPASATELITAQPYWIVQVGLGALTGTLIGWYLGLCFARITHKTVSTSDKRRERILMLIIVLSLPLRDFTLHNALGLRTIFPFVSMFVVDSISAIFMGIVSLMIKRARTEYLGSYLPSQSQPDTDMNGDSTLLPR